METTTNKQTKLFTGKKSFSAVQSGSGEFLPSASGQWDRHTRNSISLLTYPTAAGLNGNGDMEQQSAMLLTTEILKLGAAYERESLASPPKIVVNCHPLQ